MIGTIGDFVGGTMQKWLITVLYVMFFISLFTRLMRDNDPDYQTKNWNQSTNFRKWEPLNQIKHEGKQPLICLHQPQT